MNPTVGAPLLARVPLLQPVPDIPPTPPRALHQSILFGPGPGHALEPAIQLPYHRHAQILGDEVPVAPIAVGHRGCTMRHGDPIDIVSSAVRRRLVIAAAGRVVLTQPEV